jgi:hypothetical protein
MGQAPVRKSAKGRTEDDINKTWGVQIKQSFWAIVSSMDSISNVMGSQ